MDSDLLGKTILITGGTGSLGRKLTKRILEQDPKKLIIFSRDEFKQSEMAREYPEPRYFLGDVRDEKRLIQALHGVDYVIHAAALKQVPALEYNPEEAVKTNVIGTQNLIDVALDEEVDKFITVSTDKSVNPESVMGATKLLAERLTISANYYKGKRKTAFSCVRFGNVLGTRGSVVPLFKEQLKNDKRITITDPDMTRFIMSPNQAVKLMLRVAKVSLGGEIFILKMPALKVYDLASVLIEQYASEMGFDSGEVSIQVIGKRPGEKLHEELMTANEILNAYENDDYYVVLPKDYVLSEMKCDGYEEFQLTNLMNYSSNNVELLDKNEIIVLMKELNT